MVCISPLYVPALFQAAGLAWYIKTAILASHEEGGKWKSKLPNR